MRSILLSLLLALGGCKALLYAPDPHVVPLFDAPGQAQAAASLGLDAGHVQVAGTPLPHVLLFASGSLADGARHGHLNGEAGAGAYLALSRHAVLEVLAGAGLGRAEGEGERYLGLGSSGLPAYEDYRYEAASSRAFVQLNVGRRFDGGVQVGGALRVVALRYDGFETEPAGLVEGAVRGVYVEPAGVVRVPVGTGVTVEGQFGYSGAAHREHWDLFRSRGSYGSVGVRFHLGR